MKPTSTLTNPIRALAVAILIASGWNNALAAGSVDWQGWTFDHNVSGNYDGLSLSNIKFQNRTLIKKLSLPVMRVFYTNNACGPYADRLGGTLSTIPWANNATLAQRQFTSADGRLWYEIGIRDQIGSYDIYQVYYLSADGIIDAHIYSKGLQCIVNHIHYPNWRIDFDIDGPSSDVIERDTGAGFNSLTNEFNLNAASTPNHTWRVRDTVTGTVVDVLPGFPDFNIPDGNTTIPVSAFDQNTVFGRAYYAVEDTGWTFGPNVQVPYNNNEIINNTDIVLWYEGYLPHSATEGSQLWHSTGVRLVSNLGSVTPSPPPPPPPPPTAVTKTFTGGSIAINDINPSNPYPSSIDVTGMTGSINQVKVELVGLTHTYPADMDLLLVGPGGQAVKLISDIGGSYDINNITLTLDATASSILSSALVLSGTYKPSDRGTIDTFPTPAPSGTFGTDLGIFNNTSPNGIWKLYSYDDARYDIGRLNSWKLTITTR